MARRVALALAVVAGIAAALLVATSPRVHYDGHSRSCTALLVAYEVDSSTAEDLYPDPPRAGDPDWVDYQLKRACDRKQDEWTWFAGLAALVCVAAGTGARFAGRGDDQEVPPGDRSREAV